MAQMKIRSRVCRADVSKTALLTWNAFIDLLHGSSYEDLEPVQRVAHLVFWYDFEVQNGGHLQYFCNCGINRLAETMRALQELGAADHAEVLSRAAGSADKITEQPPAEAASGPEQELDELDHEYHACKPEIPELLEGYMHRHLDQFIEYED